MRLVACLTALFLVPTAWAQPAAQAGAGNPLPCRPLLTLGAAGGHDGAPLALTACDVDVVVGDAAAGSPLVLRPRGAALQRLDEVLGPQGRFFGPMLEARLRVDPATSTPDLAGFPPGVLLASESARLVTDGHWRWFRKDRTVRWMAPTATAGEPAECRALAGQRIVLWGGSLDRQPGEVVAAAPWAPGHAPGFTRPVPHSCVGPWSLSTGAPAVIDRQTGVIVLQPLPAGASPQSFTVIAQVMGRPVEGRVTSFDARQQPLVGQWVLEQAPGCDQDASAATARFRNLEFMADGTFRARAVPFESRWDAWGRYSAGAGRGQFVLRLEGGNDTGGLTAVSGTATERGDGRVDVSEIVFTPGAARSACAWTLARPR